jgi:hypothetical protein
LTSGIAESPTRNVRTSAVLVSLSIAAVPRAASAQRAAYATPEELPPEGTSHLLDVATLGRYTRTIDEAKAGGLSNTFDFALRSRLYVGRSVSYCVGLDGEIGGSNAGFVYGVTGYLAGLGTRWGAGNVLSLCGGAGLDRVGSAVPLAAKFPAELSMGVSLGPVRPVLWVRPWWVAGSDARREGATPSFVDELDLGMLVRFSPQHRYWMQTSGGGGFAMGINYRELMGTYAITASVGFAFAGEK